MHRDQYTVITTQASIFTPNTITWKVQVPEGTAISRDVWFNYRVILGQEAVLPLPLGLEGPRCNAFAYSASSIDISLNGIRFRYVDTDQTQCALDRIKEPSSTRRDSLAMADQLMSYNPLPGAVRSRSEFVSYHEQSAGNVYSSRNAIDHGDVLIDNDSFNVTWSGVEPVMFAPFSTGGFPLEDATLPFLPGVTRVEITYRFNYKRLWCSTVGAGAQARDLIPAGPDDNLFATPPTLHLRVSRLVYTKLPRSVNWTVQRFDHRVSSPLKVTTDRTNASPPDSAILFDASKIPAFTIGQLSVLGKLNRVLLFVKPSTTDFSVPEAVNPRFTSHGYSDAFKSIIRSIAVSVDGSHPKLSDLRPHDLYLLSKRNGLNRETSYFQWLGGQGSANSDPIYTYPPLPTYDLPAPGSIVVFTLEDLGVVEAHNLELSVRWAPIMGNEIRSAASSYTLHALLIYDDNLCYTLKENLYSLTS